MADRTLEDLRAEIEQRSASNEARANGMRVAPSPSEPTPIRPEPEGFDAQTIWVFPYDLNPYVDAKGHVPPPPQAMLDAFGREMGRLLLNYEQAAEDAYKAEQAANETQQDGEESGEDRTARLMAEIDQAVEEKNDAMRKMKKLTADLCQGSPSFEELEALPEYVFRAFNDAIGRKINPEV